MTEGMIITLRGVFWANVIYRMSPKEMESNSKLLILAGSETSKFIAILQAISYICI